MDEGMSEEGAEESAYKICAPLKKGHKESEHLKIKRIAEIARNGVGEVKQKGKFLVFPATLAMATISKNMVKYTEEVLQPLASPYSVNHDGGYEGAPIFKNHDVRSIDNIVGRVKNVSYAEGRLKGDLHLLAHREETKLVESGLVRHVSFQNAVHGVSCSICGKEYGKECTDHRLGEQYDDETCYIVPKKLGAIELSLVPFGGIPEATIGETLEGFESRFENIDVKKDDNNSEKDETIIIDDVMNDDDNLNKTFINEKEINLNKELFDKKKKQINEARRMSEDKKVELQYKQELAKMELEKQKLEEKLATYQKDVESFKEKERLREEALKESLIDELSQYREVSDEKRKEYMLFDVKYLKEFIEILKDTVAKQVDTSDDEPVLRAKVTTMGEKDSPLKNEVQKFLVESLWGTD